MAIVHEYPTPSSMINWSRLVPIANGQPAQVGGYLADVLDGDENNFIKSVLNVINPKVIILVILSTNIDQFEGWDWLLAWWNGYRPGQGTSLANRWHKLSINLLIVTDSIFSLCFSWCPSLKGAAMEFTDFKNNEEPAGQPFLHMNFDDGFKWDPFLWTVPKFFFFCWLLFCSKFSLCKPFFLFRDPFLIVLSGGTPRTMPTTRTTALFARGKSDQQDGQST